jgi:hypothetical protein
MIYEQRKGGIRRPLPLYMNNPIITRKLVSIPVISMGHALQYMLVKKEHGGNKMVVPNVVLDKLHLVGALSLDEIRRLQQEITFYKENEYFYLQHRNRRHGFMIGMWPKNPRASTYNFYFFGNPSKFKDHYPTELTLLGNILDKLIIKRIDVAFDFPLPMSRVIVLPKGKRRVIRRKENNNYYIGAKSSKPHLLTYDKAREMQEKGMALDYKYLTRVEFRFEPETLKDTPPLGSMQFDWMKEGFEKFIVVPDIKEVPYRYQYEFQDLIFKRKSWSKLNTNSRKKLRKEADKYSMDCYSLFLEKVHELFDFILPQTINNTQADPHQEFPYIPKGA